MHKIRYLFAIFSFLLTNLMQAQSSDTLKVDNLRSPENLRLFADYLYASGDYQRALSEYGELQRYSDSDTVKMRMAYAYYRTGEINNSLSGFWKLRSDRIFAEKAWEEYSRIKYLSAGPKNFHKHVDSLLQAAGEYKKKAGDLYDFSFIHDLTIKGNEINYAENFSVSYRDEIRRLIMKKNGMQSRSPWLAALLSAILPGSGKMYAGDYGDGVVALLFTAVPAYIAYDNYKAGHDFRAYFFAGVSAFFYAGNIYGSAASAQIFNARVEFDLMNEMNAFLKKINYFSSYKGN